MNIVLITGDFYPNLGGVAHTLMNLYKLLYEKGHTLYVFNPYSNGKNIYKSITFLEDYTFKNLIYSIRGKKFLNLALFTFWKIFRDKKVSLSHRIKIIFYFLSKPRTLIWVIENSIILDPYLKKIDFEIIMGSNLEDLPLTYILSRTFNKKLVTLAHGVDFIIRSSVCFKTLHFKTYLIKNIDRIILSNELMKKLIKKIHNLDENKLKIINRGVNIKDSEVKKTKEELRKEFNIPDNQFVLLSVGRYIPRKKFDLVIRAVSEIKTLRPKLNIKYYIIGEGGQKLKLEKLVNDLKVENEVEFLGPCSIEKRNKFYKLSDIFLMPVEKYKNDIEGFGIVFIEANYYKIPVIGTRIGGIVKAIIDGETGFLLKKNDLKELVDKIIFLYENEEIRKEMGEKGHNRVVKEYIWEKIIMDYIDIFLSLK